MTRPGVGPGFAANRVTKAEKVYAKNPGWNNKDRSTSPLLMRHYNPLGRAQLTGPTSGKRRSTSGNPVWPKPAAQFSANLIMRNSPGAAMQRPQVTPNRCATPPELREELRWDAPSPIHWVQQSIPRSDRGRAEEARKYAARALESAEVSRRKTAVLLKEEAAEAVRLAELRAAAVEETPQESRPKDAAMRRPRTPAELSGSDSEFPNSPVGIRNFSDLLSMYAAELNESLEESGLLLADGTDDEGVPDRADLLASKSAPS